jgi:DNA-binding winged helix-turn-helix (wHTH) protein/Tol biopolymer transport system component
LNNNKFLERPLSKFKVAQFTIDLDRCQINTPDNTVTLEPKVTEVLKVLYVNQGEVVSQETIFSEVWPRATFSPSSVQRSIALLRKAFGEDAKQPKFIITHPKRGYSLEIPNFLTETSKQRKNFTLLFICLSLIVVLVGAYVFSQQNTASVKATFTSLKPINSVAGNEYNLTLSPDGKNLAFIRDDKGEPSIWLKTLSSGKESRIISGSEHYSNLGWNPSGNALAYIESTNDTQQLAYITLDPITFAPLNVMPVYEFSQYKVTGHTINWGHNQVLYFVEQLKAQTSTQLAAIDLATKRKNILYQSIDQDWLLLKALSPDQRYIALAFEAGQNQYRIDLLNLQNNQLTSLSTIEDGISGLSWHPNGSHLLLSKRHELLTLNLEGEQNKVSFNNYKIIRDAQYQNDGSQIFMELVSVDVDILASTLNAPEQLETLVDTASVDFLPVFSPDGSMFTFESHRFGQKQLFLYKDGQQSLLFANPNNDELFGVAWSKESDKVFTASKDTVFSIDINTGEVTFISNPHHPFYLREAFNHSNALLVTYRAKNGTTFHPAKFDLDKQTLTKFEVKGERLMCYGIDLDAKDQLYFSDKQSAFYLSQSGEAKPLWYSPDKDILGLRVHNDTLRIIRENESEYVLTEFDLLNHTQQTSLIGNNANKMLINTTDDFNKLLFLTEPKRLRTLVRLQ